MAILAMSSIAAGRPPAAPVDPTSVAKLASEVDTSCKDYLSKLASYQYVAVSEAIDHTTKKTQRYRVESRQNGTCNLMMQVYEGGEPRLNDQVRAVNSEYTFKLGRIPGKSDWFLKEYRRVNSPRDAVDPFNMTESGDSILRGISPYHVHLHWLPDLLREPGFTITSLLPEGEFMKITFQHLPAPGKLPAQQSPEEGWVLLAPKQYWCVREFELIEKHPKATKTIQSVQEVTPGDDIPLRRRSTDRYTSRIHESGRVLSSEFVINSQYEKRKAPESEFRLSAFGLPEPVETTPQKKTVPIYIWFLVAAASSAVFAAVFRYLARRKRSLLAA
jgi:hypothetical protein